MSTDGGNGDGPHPGPDPMRENLRAMYEMTRAKSLALLAAGMDRAACVDRFERYIQAMRSVGLEAIADVIDDAIDHEARVRASVEAAMVDLDPGNDPPPLT